jgi:hypothetical protein
MISLIDALYVNNGGGKELLDYLVENTRNFSDVHFLLDERVRGQYDFLPSHRVFFLEGSLIKRHEFYLRNGSKFKIVLCFGNCIDPLNDWTEL